MLDRILKTLKGRQRLLVMTGAGISVASGLKTYRGQGGVYDDPETGRWTEHALTATTLLRHPARTWQVLSQMGAQAFIAEPNPAHLALVALEQQFEEFILLTQNVDRLHQRAGSKNPIDLHGDLFRPRCEPCAIDCEYDGALYADFEGPPSCPECGEPMRPGVVLFEEYLPQDRLLRYDREILAKPPDAILIIGTTAGFAYIARPIEIASSKGRPIIEINPSEDPCHPAVLHHWRAPAELALPALVEVLASQKSR